MVFTIGRFKPKLIVLLVFCSTCMHGQDSKQADSYVLPRHYISVDPFNLGLAQQAGIIYEFKPGMFGFALGIGYMYRNNTTWSDYIIVGPTNDVGKLGYYAGVYVIPQLNFYYKSKVSKTGAALFYAALRGVYRYMTVDSIGYVPSFDGHDGVYGANKMVDRVNIYGAFLNIGMKALHRHFLFEMSVGFGFLYVEHDMFIASSEIRNHIIPVYNPPKHEVSIFRQFPAFNVNLCFGGVFK